MQADILMMGTYSMRVKNIFWGGRRKQDHIPLYNEHTQYPSAYQHGTVRQRKRSPLQFGRYAVTVQTIRHKIRVMVVIGLFLFLVAVPSFIHGQSVAGAGAEENWANYLQEFWVFRLFLNLLGYATIFIPGFFIIRYVRQSNYLDRAGKGCLSFSLRLCIFGQEPDKGTVEEGGQATEVPATKPKDTLCQQCMRLAWCATGLLGSYLIWGLLQERIMAFEYGKTDDNPGERFKNSQFLVFMNRILAFIVGMLYIMGTRQPTHTAPMYKYSYSSFSNIMSSWCQYEALKYVSFPVQVLAKASKVIPVMLMGKLVSNKTYDLYEYVTALLISLGVGIFMLSSEDGMQGEGKATTVSGLIILIGYLTFDAFTSNWQGELFRQHHMTSMQMMAGVNLFSVVFTTVSLTEQGGFIESFAFMTKYPNFIFHITVLSVTSATGQLFIFYTISKFGAVTFTIIMTIRQGVAILLSCLIYHHPVNVKGLLGIMCVFGAVVIRIYCNQLGKKKPLPTKVTEPPTSPVPATGSVTKA